MLRDMRPLSEILELKLADNFESLRHPLYLCLQHSGMLGQRADSQTVWRFLLRIICWTSLIVSGRGRRMVSHSGRRCAISV